MQLRTFSQETLWRVLANPGTSGNYTQSFSRVFETAPGCARVVYMLVGAAALNVAFTVTIATNASGTSPTDLAVVTANTANGLYTYEITPGDLTATRQFVSAKVTVTGGTYALLECRHALYRSGDLTSFYSSTWVGRQNSPSIP